MCWQFGVYLYAAAVEPELSGTAVSRRSESANDSLAVWLYPEVKPRDIFWGVKNYDRPKITKISFYESVLNTLLGRSCQERGKYQGAPFGLRR